MAPVRVLVYTYYPFFDTHLGGGVQNWLRSLLEHINKSYDDVSLTVLCPDSDMHAFPETIRVLHKIHDLESDFLEPSDIYADIQTIKAHVDEADVVWLIDRNLPYCGCDKPMLMSLNAICYKNEINAFFNSGDCSVVVPSYSTREQLLNLGKENHLIQVIPYYADTNLKSISREKAIEIMSEYFCCDADKKYILFPHRPEKDKGHHLAIEIMKKLVAKDQDYILLIPEPPFSRVDDVEAERKYVADIKTLVHESGLDHNVVFHPWIRGKDMAAYYSLGDFTLFLSQLPETFGLSLLNSILCGVPAISYGSGALRETVPPGKSHFVFDKTDVDGIVNRILLGTCKSDIDDDIAWVRTKYNIAQISQQYVQKLKEIHALAMKS